MRTQAGNGLRTIKIQISVISGETLVTNFGIRFSFRALKLCYDLDTRRSIVRPKLLRDSPM